MKPARLLTLLLAALPLLPFALAATPDDEITHLIAFVRQSGAVLIRNGREHTPAEAADHLERKRRHFAKEIRTAEDFIRLAASRSLISGQPYRVRTPDGRTQACEAWLTAELHRLRETRETPAAPAAPAPCCLKSK